MPRAASFKENSRPNIEFVYLETYRHIIFKSHLSIWNWFSYYKKTRLSHSVNIQAQQKLIAFGCVPATRFFLFGILFNLRKCKFRKCKGKSDKIRAWWNKRKKILFASLNNKCLACFRLKSQSLWHLFACSPVMHCFVASKHVIKSCKESINPKKKSYWGESVDAIWIPQVPVRSGQPHESMSNWLYSKWPWWWIIPFSKWRAPWASIILYAINAIRPFLKN